MITISVQQRKLFDQIMYQIAKDGRCLKLVSEKMKQNAIERGELNELTSQELLNNEVFHELLTRIGTGEDYSVDLLGDPVVMDKMAILASNSYHGIENVNIPKEVVTYFKYPANVTCILAGYAINLVFEMIFNAEEPVTYERREIMPIELLEIIVEIAREIQNDQLLNKETPHGTC